MSDEPVRLDPEVIQSRIVDRIFQGLRQGAATEAAGYTQSEGKNYGMYQKDGSAFERLPEVERIAREIASQEAARIISELQQEG